MLVLLLLTMGVLAQVCQRHQVHPVSLVTRCACDLMAGQWQLLLRDRLQ